MTTELWSQIGKYGFTAIALAVVAIYYREDVVKPAREQTNALIKINQQQADSAAKQNNILAKMQANGDSTLLEVKQLREDTKNGVWLKKQ